MDSKDHDQFYFGKPIQGIWGRPLIDFQPSDKEIKTSIHHLAEHCQQFNMTRAMAIEFAEKRIFANDDSIRLILQWQQRCRLCASGDRSSHEPRF